MKLTLKPGSAMRLTITQKQEIVEQFAAGKALHVVRVIVLGSSPDSATRRERDIAVEQVLRDYMNGRFSLGKEVR